MLTHEPTIEFFDKHKICVSSDHVFKKIILPTFACLYLTNKISNGFDSVLLAEMILNDLEKYFQYKNCPCLDSHLK